MNILDKIESVLDMPNVKLGFMPDKPDALVGLFEYSGVPPNHFFNATDYVQNVQARIRAVNSSAAYDLAKLVEQRLNRYHDGEISIIQSTPILDIGYDEANPQRQEYTINFTIRRL